MAVTNISLLLQIDAYFSRLTKITNMKKILLLLWSIIIASGLMAQTTIINSDMENFTNVGAANEEPTQWNSSKSGINNAGLAPQKC